MDREWPITRRSVIFPFQIWMPRSTPLIKLSATRAYGADVVLHGDSYDEACAAAS